MKRVPVAPALEAWRIIARQALAEGFRPDEIDLQDETVASPLDLALELDAPPSGAPTSNPHVPRAFLAAAASAAVHRDPQRWNLLYRLLHRLQSEHGLMLVEVDDDVAALRRLTEQVRHDLHKMHAFVRFRKLEEANADGIAQDHYIAWYQPAHRILRLAAPFFAERFAIMRWTILTPDESVHWEPAAKQLQFGEGVGKEHGPQEDGVEDLWKSYYASIFNPARLNPRAMRSEMPLRYWQNLPEVALLPELMQRAEGRVATMMSKQQDKTTAEPFVPPQHTLPALRKALPKCEGCELYKCATQVVPGAGNENARLMLVGEQPGDQEDLAGEPFVGPAGNVLRKALEELRIAPESVFMTNAVKHFKFIQRGKFRLHQNPRMSEITACRPWLLAEMEAIKPQIVVCLGASASKSLLGGTFALMKSRGQVQESSYGTQNGVRIIATVHPSAVLRARDQPGRDQLYTFLKDDLALAHQLATKGS